MTSSTPPKLTKKDELARMKRRGGLQRGERIRLTVLTAGLALAIGIFFYVRSKGNDDNFKLPGPLSQNQTSGADVVFPPLDIEQLFSVKDSTSSDRLTLDSQPFAHLLKLSQSLHPGHLDAIGSPTMDFETIEANSAGLRGAPYRLRGNLKAMQTQKRTVGGPEETWAWIQTDEGKNFFYASLNQPEDLFGSDGMFVVMEGFYYKIYTQVFEDERITAPLLVGRGMRPSIHKAEPAKALDFEILGRVKDDKFEGGSEIATEGYWHLMNFVTALASDPPRYEQAFASAVPFDKKLLVAMAADPAPFRGKPVVIHANPVHDWTEACQENSHRLQFDSHVFLNKYEFGDKYIRAAAPGREAFKGLSLRHELLGYFLRLWAYEDNKGVQRRVPIFVIAGVREREKGTSLLEGQIMQWFLALFLVLVIGFVVLIRRDKKQAQQAIADLRQRRNRHRD
jgi:hypothetical protein